jgi:hypothetical protein
MKKIIQVVCAVACLTLGSCGDKTDTNSSKGTDTTAIDSSANNSILPPPSTNSSAGNSSLADTAYKADTVKSKKDSSGKK